MWRISAALLATALWLAPAVAQTPPYTPLVGFGGSHAAPPPPVPTITLTDSGTGNGGSYNVGSAVAGRIIAAAISTGSAAGGSITGVTICGIGASQAVDVSLGGAASGDHAALWYATVASGTACPVSVSNSNALTSFGVSVYRLTNVAGLYNANGAASSSVAFTVPAGNSVTIGVTTNVHVGGASFTWGNMNIDTQFGMSNPVSQTSAASNSFTSISSPFALGVTASPSATIAQGIAAASWQ